MLLVDDMAVPPDVDINLMLTIAEASATFVAIVAGFFTTKIISISGEKKRLRSRLAELEAELISRDRLAKRYKSVMDGIESRWARGSIDNFIRRLLSQEEIEVYSLEEMKAKFRTFEECELNEFEENVLRERYDEIRGMITGILEGRTPSIFDVGSLALSIDSSVRIAERESVVFSENKGKFLIEESEIIRCQNMKQQYKADLDADTFPSHMRFGFTSQIIFAVLGVLIPLSYASWSEIFAGVTSNILVIGLFGVV